MSVDGKVGTVVGKGSTTIKATCIYNGKTYTDSFIYESSIGQIITNNDATLYVIDTEQSPNSLELFAFADEFDITDKATFVSSKPNVAYVLDGRLYAKSEGSAVITANYVLGDKTYTATFTVNVVDNTPVLSTNSDTTLYTVERTASTPKSTALFLKKSGVDVTDVTGVYFTSSEPTVVKVSNNTITALKAGTSVVTGYYPFAGKTYSVSFNVTVVDNSPVLTVNPDSNIYLLNEGLESKYLDLFVKEGNTDLTANATFVSNNTSIVKIENGMAVSVGVGSAVVTASVVFGGQTFTKSFTVTVIDNSPELSFNGNSTIYLHGFDGQPNFLELQLLNGNVNVTDLASYTTSSQAVTISGVYANANRVGNSTITASYVFGGHTFTASFVVTVVDNSVYTYVDGVKSSTVQVHINPIYGHNQATLSVQSALTGELPVVYSMDIEGVAEINGNVVTALAAGRAVITATYTIGNVTYVSYLDLAVVEDIPDLETLSDTDLYVYGDYQGDYPASATLFITDNGLDVLSKTVFTSSDPAVASISGNKIVAHKAGVTVITATYTVASMPYVVQFNVFVHGIETVSEVRLASISSGKVEGLLDTNIIQAKYNNSEVAVSNGVITSGLTLNVNESSPSTLFMVTDKGVYSYTNVLVYDVVLFTEDDFINYFKVKYTSAEVGAMLPGTYTLKSGKDIATAKSTDFDFHTNYTQEYLSGYVALGADIYTTKTLTTAANYSVANDPRYLCYEYDGYVFEKPLQITGTLTYSVNNRHFTGTFDGRGHVISGLTLGNSYGIFGQVEGATIKNVGFTNIRMPASNSAVLGYKANNSSTISNVLIEVDSTYSGNYRSGALFYTQDPSTTETGTATYKDVLVVYPEFTPNPSTYCSGGTLFGFINSSATLYSTRFTNVVVISKSVPVASTNSSGYVWVPKDDGSNSTVSGYSTKFVLDGGRGRVSGLTYKNRATVIRYATYQDMLNAGVYKVGTWAYNDFVSDYVYQDGEPIIKSLSDVMLLEDETLPLYVTVNGVKVSGGSFTSSNTSVATISGTTLKAVGTGNATITAYYTFGGKSYTSTFKVSVQSGNIINVSEETLVSISDSKILGLDAEIIAARQDDVQLSVENGKIVDGLFIKTEKVNTVVNGMTTTNDNILPSTITVFTTDATYVFSNALVYDKVITTAEEAYDIFSTYNDGNYGITTGYYALGNDIDAREMGVIKHVATGSRETTRFNHTFTITDSNGNTVTKQLGFQGYLDGRGHYLSYNATMGGLFGRLRAGSVVKNIAFRDVVLPVYNAGDTFNNVIAFSGDTKGSNVLIQDVYVSINDFVSKALGQRTATIFNTYDSNSFAYIKNLVVELDKPTEEGDNPSYGYGALFVREDMRNTSTLSMAASALENVYVITGEKMPMASLLGTTTATYVVYAGNEQADTYAGARTVYKYSTSQVQRYNTLQDMLGNNLISSKLGTADVWNNFYNKTFDVKVNGKNISSLNLYTKDSGDYRDHATVYAYLNAKKIPATFTSSNDNVVIYENEQFVATGVGSATITVSYEGVEFYSIDITVRDIITVKTQEDLEQIFTSPNAIVVLEQDVVLDNFTAPDNFTFTGLLDGQGQAIKGTVTNSVLGILDGATIQNVAFKLDSGKAIIGAFDSFVDNVCVIGDMDLSGITVTNSIINYVEYDTIGDRSGFNRDYWDFTYGLEWKFRYTYEGTHVYDYTETENYIVKDGMSDYVILMPDDANSSSLLKNARDELIRLFRRATGVKLEAFFENSTHEAVQNALATGKYISLGETELFASTGIELSEDLGSDGAIIRTVGNSVYIVGGSNYGTLYGVYDFLTICFDFEPYYKDCVVINTNVTDLKLYDFNVTDIPDFYTRAQNHGFISSANADIIINDVTYSESSETLYEVGSENYNTVYTDATMFATRSRVTNSYREVMTILTDQYYTVDENGVIELSSLVDLTTGELVNEGALTVRDKLINGKSVNGTSIHNTSEYFPFDTECYTAQGNLLPGLTSGSQDIYLSDRTPGSVNSSTSIRHICYTTHGDANAYNTLVQAFANKLIQGIIIYQHKSLSSKDYAVIMNEDNGLHCNCADCLAAVEYYGSRSGLEIKFTNDVYDRVAEWMNSIKDDAVLGRYYNANFKLFYCPYGETNLAPMKNGRPTIVARENVGMFLCASRTLDYSQGLYDEINDAGRNDFIVSWKSVSQYFLFWLYQTNFSSYVSFYDTTESYNSEAYQFYANFGAIHFASQSQSGQGGSATAFTALQAYVNNKLRWDTNLDVDTLVDNYFTAMYGSDVNTRGTSAWYMKKMFNEVCDASVEYCEKYDIYKAPSHGQPVEERAHWTVEKIARWLDYCDKAIEVANRTVSTSYLKDTVIRHIRMEKIFPLYMAIVTQRTAYSEADYYALIEEFKDIVDQVGIEDYQEHDTMKNLIATFPTATFESSNVSGSYAIGTEIPVSIKMQLSDRLTSSEIVNGRTVKITSSNTSCAQVNGTTVKIVGEGLSVITVEYRAGFETVYSYTFTVASGLKEVAGLYVFSAYDGEDANDEERRIDSSLFNGDIVSVKDQNGNELLLPNGEVNISNDTNKEIYTSVIVTDSTGEQYLVNLVVYTRFIYDAEDFTQIFLQPEYYVLVRQYVLKAGATQNTLVGNFDSRVDEYVTKGSSKYFAFNYELQEGDVRQNDSTTSLAKDITGAYALRNDIEGVKTGGAYQYKMAGWGSVANAQSMSSSGDNQGYKLAGINLFYSAVAFRGTLDGMGYSIKDSFVQTEGGLFGKLAGATIKNIAIEDITLSGGNQSVIAYSTDGSTVLENLYISVKDFATYGGYYGNRQSVLISRSDINIAGWKIKNTLIVCPEIEINTNYGGGVISFLAHNTNGMPIVDNLIVISETTQMSAYSNYRVWLAENDTALKNTIWANASSTNARTVKGAFRYATPADAQTKNITNVGNWHITYTEDGGMTVAWGN